jgi:hypothetical protein
MDRCVDKPRSDGEEVRRKEGEKRGGGDGGWSVTSDRRPKRPTQTYIQISPRKKKETHMHMPANDKTINDGPFSFFFFLLNSFFHEDKSNTDKIIYALKDIYIYIHMR